MALKNWREDHGIKAYNRYKKRFAWLPVVCSDTSVIWWKNYYSVYIFYVATYLSPDLNDMSSGHKDFSENITEAEFLVRKLAESL